jgi:hypothetical protein
MVIAAMPVDYGPSSLAGMMLVQQIGRTPPQTAANKAAISCPPKK